LYKTWDVVFVGAGNFFNIQLEFEGDGLTSQILDAWKTAQKNSIDDRTT